MQTATLITGKVKYAASTPKDFGHGERINVVISPLTGGDDIKVWGNPDDAIASLSKNQQVTLLFDGKTYKLVADNQPQTVNQTQPVTTELSADQKRAADRHSASPSGEMCSGADEEVNKFLAACFTPAGDIDASNIVSWA